MHARCATPAPWWSIATVSTVPVLLLAAVPQPMLVLLPDCMHAAGLGGGACRGIASSAARDLLPRTPSTACRAGDRERRRLSAVHVRQHRRAEGRAGAQPQRHAISAQRRRALCPVAGRSLHAAVRPDLRSFRARHVPVLGRRRDVVSRAGQGPLRAARLRAPARADHVVLGAIDRGDDAGHARAAPGRFPQPAPRVVLRRGVADAARARLRRGRAECGDRKSLRSNRSHHRAVPAFRLPARHRRVRRVAGGRTDRRAAAGTSGAGGRMSAASRRPKAKGRAVPRRQPGHRRLLAAPRPDSAALRAIRLGSRATASGIAPATACGAARNMAWCFSAGWTGR